MDEPYIRVERKVLYDQVWSQPMTRLAKQYGISDVALAKTCKRLNIPRPGRGYWQKLKRGIAIMRPSLPEAAAAGHTEVLIGAQKTKEPEPQHSEAVERQLEYENAPANRLHVPSRLGKLHPILALKEKALRDAKPDIYGALRSIHSHSLNLRVSKASLPRALRILNTLYRALDRRGYKITLSSGQRPKLHVTVLSESLEFGLEERFQRLKRDATSETSKDEPWWRRDRYEYRSTGELSLRIKDYLGRGVRQLWSDSKRQKLEDLLNEFIVGLVRAAEAVKAIRLERERWHQEWLAEQQRREELEKKRREEQARIQRLEEDAANWAKAQQIRNYLAVFKATAERAHGQIEPDSEIQRWLLWAQRQADRLDPLTEYQDSEEA